MKKITSVFLTILILTLGLSIPTAEAAQYSSYDFTTSANEIISWKKSKAGTGNCLFTQDYMSKTVANADGDWYAVYMGRFGFEDYPENYLNAITNFVIEKYNTNGTLSDKYATDYHRIALAVKSAGGDPQNVGGINLIADGVYNRGYTASLGKQGLNGWVWGLITLDSIGVQIPSGSYYTRDDIIKEILKYQLKDGGFSILPAATKSDPDTTAMALYALAPYQYNTNEYTYKQNSTRKNVTKSVNQIVNEAVSFLSQDQLSDGGYASFGVTNGESSGQVVIALCSLGIDPQSDSRFIKNKSAVDALMSYKQRDGGFAHTAGGASDAMASEQALGAMAALQRFYSGATRLFDFTDGIIMTTFTPKVPNEKPTIPVPQKPNNNTNSNSDGSSNGGSAASSQNSAGSNHTAGNSTSTNSSALNNASATHNSSANSSHSSSGSSVKATEKQSNKNKSSKNTESSTISDESIITAENNGDNSNIKNTVNNEISGSNETPLTLTLLIVFLPIIIACAVLAFYFYKKKKSKAVETESQNESESNDKAEEEKTQ